MLRRRLDPSGVDAGGESGGEQELTRKWGGGGGGVNKQREVGVNRHPSIFRRRRSGLSS